MIDIETLDTTASAVVIQIAAVAFDYNDKGQVKILGEFDAKLHTSNQIHDGRTISEDTVKFWLSSDKQQLLLGDLLRSPDDHYLTDLENFYRFCNTSKAQEYWSQGPTFDMIILEDMIKPADMPWKFYQVRDLRTVQKFVGDDAKSKKMKAENSNHNALDDCHSQIKLLQHFIKKVSK